MKRLFSLFCMLLLAFCSEAKEQSEYTLKGAFVERFTRFIVWPDTLHNSDTVYLGIVGKGESFKSLTTFFKDVKIQGKPVAVLNVVSLNSLQQFHILFIEDESEYDVETLRRKMSTELTVLTIGNDAQMASDGLMISFFLEGNKLKFNINTGELEHAGFKVSAFLLKMAVIVETGAENE